MLNPQEAEKRLEKVRLKDWHKKRVAASAGLPEKLRNTARALIERDPAGKVYKNWQKERRARDAAFEWLTRASAKDRQKVFAALFPKLAPQLEAGWQLLSQLPYEHGYHRKGFRAPSQPDLHKERREGWLNSLINTLQGFDEDIVWAAAWAPHLSGGHNADEIGILCAAAINAGGPVGEQVFEVLRDSTTNQHEVGRMGRHVTRGLLVASRPDGWEQVEKLLLAAQRQEGLRQVILETIDEAHPEAFRRLLKLILEHNLLRFSATVRAIDVWLGLQWDAPSAGVVKKTVEAMLRFLGDPAARAEALAKETGEPLYLALWALGFEDAAAAVGPAAALLKDKSVERRYVAVKFLEDLDLPAARLALVEAIDDADPRIAVKALEVVHGGRDEKDVPDLWDKIVALRERLPEKKTEGEALVWPWATVDLDRKQITNYLVQRLGKRPATVLIPFLPDLTGYGRVQLIERIGKLKKWDAAMRDTLFTLAGDRDGWVRNRALDALKKCDVTEADAARIEGLLVKKGSEMRQGVIGLLKKQKTPLALASADRLLASKKVPQRVGGLELLRELVAKKRATAECRTRAEEYRAKYPELSEDEALHIEAVLDIQREKPSLKNALGMMNPENRSKPIEPQAKKVTLLTPAAIACLASLNDLIAANAKTAVRFEDEEDDELLGNVSSWQWPNPDTGRPAEEERRRLPLAELWEEWYAKRPAKLKDKDGLELVRAYVWAEFDLGTWRARQKRFGKGWGEWLKLMSAGEVPPAKMKHRDLAREVIDWLIRLHPPEKLADFLMDVQETAYALVPAEARKRVVNVDNWQKRDQDWRSSSPLEEWLQAREHFEDYVEGQCNDSHRLRRWRLAHWRDEPVRGVARFRPDLGDFLVGFKAGEANADDVYDQLLGAGEQRFWDLSRLTQPGAAEVKDHPGLAPYLDRIRERILEIELKRGEMQTAASEPAKRIMSLYGIDRLMTVLGVLGKKPFARATYGEGRAEVLTHFAQVTYPAEGETPEAFALAARKAGLSRERLLELGFAAPQWLDHVEHAVGWSGLKEGAWWFLAHMPGARSGVGGAEDEDHDFDDFDDDDLDEMDERQEQRLDPWERIIRDRTTLTEEERNDGAIDAGWFHRAFEPLGGKRWEALGAAAKFGCTGNAHKKALLLSDALLGKAKKNELISNIRDRKLKEPVRLLGLMPLPEGERREPELALRYKVLVEYRRYTKTLSPMSKEDAERTARIGLENLARTAGYPDPMRLEWAMEARELADLAQGPVSVTADGVTVTLAITPQAQPEVTVRRGDKPLKQVPPLVRKSPKVAALLERRTELKRSASRVKYSMEAAMVRGDTFTGRELRQLTSHPLLKPVLERLVILGEGIRGYPVADGQALEDYAGKKEPVKPDEKLRIAHPHDLYAAKDWDRWQHDLFARERVQPFKQVFRELYLVTAQEREDQFVSRRYAGQQVNPSQAMALWGSRSWSVRDGDVSKTFTDDRLVVDVDFRHHGWTAAQVEGHTLDTIQFRRRGSYERVALADVPPRVFSEVMRDCDLVVSVAHVGGVDPEASASTVQMRTSLLRELCSLLNITNYRVEKNHVFIDGTLGKYSVHLGSAVVHRLPGGHVCIVPVHAQHRGRLFLPFADDDPRSAEVMSKVMLLARDHEIQDPSILEQLR